jgi:hypothetical protein
MQENKNVFYSLKMLFIFFNSSSPTTFLGIHFSSNLKQKKSLPKQTLRKTRIYKKGDLNNRRFG